MLDNPEKPKAVIITNLWQEEIDYLQSNLTRCVVCGHILALHDSDNFCLLDGCTCDGTSVHDDNSESVCLDEEEEDPRRAEWEQDGRSLDESQDTERFFDSLESGGL